MGVEQQTILSNDSHDLISWQDTSNKGFSNHKFKLENCLPKYKASNINYPLFQKLKDFTYDIDIQEFTDWYSKLDRATKRKITSYNSQELIHFLRKLYSKEILGNNEVKSKNFCDKEQNFEYEKPREEVHDIYSKDNYEEGKVSDENDIETTKETENTEEQNLDKDKFNEKDILKYIKICSLEDVADTLILNIELIDLKEYVKYFSKGDSKIKPINIELKDNEWYYTLPNWDNIQSFLQIIICTLILLHYEYYLLTNKLYEMPYFNKLKDFFQENDSKLNELIGNKVDTTNEIFSKHNLIFLAEECSYNYIEKYSDEEFKSDKNKFYQFNIKILEELKNNLSEFKTNEEKLKFLFEKVSFYNLKDLKDAKHFFYFEFRKFLLKYNDQNQKLNVFYRNVIYNTEKLKPIKDKYLEKTKTLLKDILNNNEEIIEFGSYFTGLATEFSDIDILIFYEDCIPEFRYGELLQNDLEIIKDKKNIKNLKIKLIYSKKHNSIPVIKIEYDVSEEINLNEINFSLKYLDGYEDDLKKIKIDITFTNEEKRVKNTKNVRRIIKQSLNKYIQLKPVILYSKIYFKRQGMDSTYEGGINCISLFCLPRNILVMYEQNDFPINSFSNLIILLDTSKKFGHYNYLYGIDKDGYDYKLKGLEKQIDKEQKDRRFVIKNPADYSKNIASGCFETSKIIDKFNLLYTHINKGKDIFLPLQEII